MANRSPRYGQIECKICGKMIGACGASKFQHGMKHVRAGEAVMYLTRYRLWAFRKSTALDRIKGVKKRELDATRCAG